MHQVHEALNRQKTANIVWPLYPVLWEAPYK